MQIFEHERITSRLERIQKRLWLAELIGLALLIASNAAWALRFLGR